MARPGPQPQLEPRRERALQLPRSDRRDRSDGVGRPLARGVGRFTNLWTRAPRVSVAISRAHGALYRRTAGRFAPRWFFGAPVMVIETRGRKTGKPRAAPVLYLRAGETLVVVPANAGARRAPAWWLNLQASGHATAVIAGERISVLARRATPAESARLWPRLVAMYPAMGCYVGFTTREIPVVMLEPRAREGAR